LKRGNGGDSIAEKLFKIKNKTDVIARLSEAIFRFVFSVYELIETKLKIATAFSLLFLLEKASQ
jgi:hypothetical protein